MTASITWSTDSESSSVVEYGLTAGTRSPTSEINTSPRVTSHSVNLTGLVQCTTYDYRVISTDASSNITTSVGNTFTTSGCATAATVVDTSTEQITTATGGTLILENTVLSGEDNSTVTVVNGITLDIPSDFSTTDANFQAQQLNKTTALEEIPKVSETPVNLIDNSIYELRAVTEDGSVISSFESDLTMTMTYSADDIAGVKEETLKIYSSDGASDWDSLNPCIVDTSDKTVTCSTDHFTVFALFGEPEDSIPTVTTPTSTSLTTTGATIGANVTSLGIPASISARGTCWGTTASPVTNCTAEGGTTTGVFTQVRTGLTAGTLYYYRGYATNATGTAYSSDGTFTTLSNSGSG